MKVIKYVQMGTVGLSKIMPTGRNGRLIYDDPKKGRRQIRHCTNEKTPFIEDQSDFATVTPIIFKRGFFEIKPEEKVTIEFMELHPGNASNGGNLFRREDAEKEAKDGLFLEDLIIDLKYQTKKLEEEKAGFLKLQAICSVIEGSYTRIQDKTASELRQIIYSHINNAPMSFINDKNEPELLNEDLLRNFMAIKAIDREVVKVSPDNRQITWGGKSGKKITDVPAGRRPKEYFAEYLATDDGRLVATQLENKL